jgi:hypothetical protein
MAQRAVQNKALSIRLACCAFRTSEFCYRYEGKTSAENEEIANWLLRLTDNHLNWGFGLCFLYLRNVKRFDVIDDYNRDALGIEIDFSLPSERIIRAFKQIISWRGKPLVIRCENGPENISGTIQN